MADSAAFFDLDRTLLLGASGPVISQSLRRQGLIRQEPIPGERLVFGLFNLIGESLPAILATRQGARAARGWPLDRVRKAAADVAEPLADLVEPFARETIDDHRRAGRKLVLATTTPYDLVVPFAERLGFDDVLATRYRIVDRKIDGPVYDGTIDGEFVWSGGKARSVVVWATANMIELADSYAYSDSVFDIPMLSRVGYPVAVNPDPRLLAYAALRGWPRVWFNAPPGVAKPVGVELQELLTTLARPELLPWVNIEIDGLSNLPTEGGALLAANHRSYLDPLAVAYATAKVGRPARFLAKKEVTDSPIVGSLATALGAIRIDRGSGDESPMVEAARAVRAGELIAMFPQGTIPRGQAFFEPELKGRFGAIRLALETGASIVPVGLWGTERAWPRNARLPYLMNLADRPTVTITFGSPYRPATEELGAATEELMERIGGLLPPQARRRYVPTAEELARTHPGPR
ncbi:MAG: HAD-IB family hydrolase [Acidimicrobiales bacterium]